MMLSSSFSKLRNPVASLCSLQKVVVWYSQYELRPDSEELVKFGNQILISLAASNGVRGA